jgi:putative methyltransferase (TIGR04325 family)
MRPILRSAAIGAAQSPLLRIPLSPVYRWYFERAAGQRRLFQGVYRDFSEAVATIPQDRSIGFDNPGSSDRVAHARSFLSAYDYPVLFWLAQLLQPGTVVFDWGGNVGVSFYAYRNHIHYPERLEWVVSDVPAVVELGRRLADAEHCDGLTYTTTLERLSSADILLSAGALQFIDEPFAMLRELGCLPAHVLLNKIPAYDQPHAVTVQNMGTSLCPYHLFNRREFVERFQDLGYVMADSWNNPGLGCFIPFYPDYSIAAFSGFYFRLNGPGNHRHHQPAPPSGHETSPGSPPRPSSQRLPHLLARRNQRRHHPGLERISGWVHPRPRRRHSSPAKIIIERADTREAARLPRLVNKGVRDRARIRRLDPMWSILWLM